MTSERHVKREREKERESQRIGKEKTIIGRSGLSITPLEREIKRRRQKEQSIMIKTDGPATRNGI